MQVPWRPSRNIQKILTRWEYSHLYLYELHVYTCSSCFDQNLVSWSISIWSSDGQLVNLLPAGYEASVKFLVGSTCLWVFLPPQKLTVLWILFDFIEGCKTAYWALAFKDGGIKKLHPLTRIWCAHSRVGSHITKSLPLLPVFEERLTGIREILHLINSLRFLR